MLLKMKVKYNQHSTVYRPINLYKEHRHFPDSNSFIIQYNKHRQFFPCNATSVISRTLHQEHDLTSDCKCFSIKLEEKKKTYSRKLLGKPHRHESCCPNQKSPTGHISCLITIPSPSGKGTHNFYLNMAISALTTGYKFSNCR